MERFVYTVYVEIIKSSPSIEAIASEFMLFVESLKVQIVSRLQWVMNDQNFATH